MLFIDTACFAIHEACRTKLSVFPCQHNTAGLRKFVVCIHACRRWRNGHLESFQFCKSVKVPRLVTYAQVCRARLCCCKAATRTSRIARGPTGRRRSSFRQPACLPDTLSRVFDRVLSCRLRSQAQRPPCFCHREKITVVAGSTTSEKASKLIATDSVLPEVQDDFDRHRHFRTQVVVP